MIRKKLVVLGIVGVMAINNVTMVKAESLKANENISFSSVQNNSGNKELEKAKRKAKNHAENLLEMSEDLYNKDNSNLIVKDLLDNAKEKIDNLHRLGGNTIEITTKLERIEKKINKDFKGQAIKENNKKSEENIKEVLENTKNTISQKKLAEAKSLILLATHYIGKAEKEAIIDVSKFKKELINLMSANDNLYWELTRENSKLKDEINKDILKIDDLLRNKELAKCNELYENAKNKSNNFKYEDLTHIKKDVEKIKNRLKIKKKAIDTLRQELNKEVKVVEPVKEIVIQKDNKNIEKNINEIFENAKKAISEKKLSQLNGIILLATHHIEKAEKEAGMDVSEFKKELINLMGADNNLYWELTRENLKLKDEINKDIAEIDDLLRNKELAKCKELYKNAKNKSNNFKYEDLTHIKKDVQKIKDRLKIKKQAIDTLNQELNKKVNVEVDKEIVMPEVKLVKEDMKVVAPKVKVVEKDLEVVKENIKVKNNIAPIKNVVNEKNKLIVPVKELVLVENKGETLVQHAAISNKEMINEKEYIKYNENNNVVKENIPVKAVENTVNSTNSSKKDVNKTIAKVNKVNENKIVETNVIPVKNKEVKNKDIEEVTTNSQAKVEDNNLENIKIENNKAKEVLPSENKDKIQLIKSEKSPMSKGLIAGIVGAIVAIGAGIVLFLRKKF